MSSNHQANSLNSTFNGHADTIAAYRFFNDEKVTAEVLIETSHPGRISGS